MKRQGEITMENYNMAAESAGGVAIIKLYGLKVVLGMLGAAMLYMVLPPLTKDGKFDKREFVGRLAIAGLFSAILGDWAVDVLGNWPWLYAANHKAAVYLIVGAPGWWISRAVALWFHNRRNHDAGQLIRDGKDTL